MRLIVQVLGDSIVCFWIEKLAMHQGTISLKMEEDGDVFISLYMHMLPKE